jgi:hypothetical protein
MQLALAAKPTIDVFSELTNIPWVRYTLMMPGAMRMISPLCAAMIEEVFFRGAIFLILIIDFPEIGAYLPIFVCTVLRRTSMNSRIYAMRSLATALPSSSVSSSG